MLIHYGQLPKTACLEEKQQQQAEENCGTVQEEDVQTVQLIKSVLKHRNDDSVQTLLKT